MNNEHIFRTKDQLIAKLKDLELGEQLFADSISLAQLFDQKAAYLSEKQAKVIREFAHDHDCAFLWTENGSRVPPYFERREY